ncbi:glycosyltransferase family 9 protein [bacterium]|nr:glycosyltransferase family 9 protein [bacterium]
MKPTSVKNILIVKLRTLGDVLTTFPLLRALKELYPDSRITMITDDVYQELIATNPRVDQVWTHPARQLRTAGWFQAVHYYLQTLKKIRQQKFNLYLDLYGSMRTAQWGFWGGIPRRLGFDLRGRKYFYSHRIRAAHRYVVDLNLQFAQTLGWQGKSNGMEFFLTPEDVETAQQVLRQQGWQEKIPSVVVSPGGGWPLKLWEAKKFGQVAKALREKYQCQVILSGSETEESLVTACARELGDSAIRVLGLPLRQVAAVIKGSRLFIGNDSGPKYFAESFGVPTLICYGPTDFKNNNPDTPNNRVLYHDVPCRPCHSENCQQDRRSCLDDVTIAEAIPQAMELWEMGKNGQ